jgi:transcriptional regulator with XRE-family HTH domain
VLLALPALISQGLLRYENEFQIEKVYYPTSSVFLSLAILSLLRVKNNFEKDLKRIGQKIKEIRLAKKLTQSSLASSCDVDITQPIIIKFEDIALMHYFEYNGDRFSITEGKLRNYVETIERQLVEGRESIAIHIFSSASYVPTRSFKTNDNLARSRANRIKSELDNYFTAKGYSAKVKIVIDGTAVQGPLYENDSDNTEKYKPFQFIDLKTK